MDRSECSSRLLASAMHELRNALAVIRECVGLASDVARLQARGGEAARNIPKCRILTRSSARSAGPRK